MGSVAPMALHTDWADGLERSDGFSDEAVSSERQVPQWWTEAIQRISLLLDLSDNWDSYGAKAPNISIAYCAVDILQEIALPGIPQPTIVPTPRGNIQFEWHEQGIDLELEVLSQAKISVSFEDSETGLEWDKELNYNLTPLSDSLRLLISRKMLMNQAIGNALNA
jgi:hypothetical protein